MKIRLLSTALLFGLTAAFAAAPDAKPDKLHLTDVEWKARLTPEQYNVLRKHGTERAFSGALWKNHAEGTYVCAACALPLFSSKTKFESGTGWPSFWDPITPSAVNSNRDESFGMVRDEVGCARCGGHLGHVFEDGPPPTGLRYCMNSVALKFEPAAARPAADEKVQASTAAAAPGKKAAPLKTSAPAKR